MFAPGDHQVDALLSAPIKVRAGLPPSVGQLASSTVMAPTGPEYEARSGHPRQASGPMPAAASVRGNGTAILMEGGHG